MLDASVRNRFPTVCQILDHDDVPHREAEADGDGGALALIRRLEENADAVLSIQFPKELAGSVGRPVVHDENFLLDGDGEHERDDLADRIGFVVDRHYDGQLHRASRFSFGSSKRYIEYPTLPAARPRDAISLLSFRRAAAISCSP